MEMAIISFRGLQNYTTLKLSAEDKVSVKGFRGLQNYTTLKQPSAGST